MSGVSNPDVPPFPSSTAEAPIDADLTDRIAVVTGRHRRHRPRGGVRAGRSSGRASSSSAAPGPRPIGRASGAGRARPRPGRSSSSASPTCRGRRRSRRSPRTCAPGSGASTSSSTTPAATRRAGTSRPRASRSPGRRTCSPTTCSPTGLLEPLRAAGGRVVYVASTMAGGLDVDDLLWERRRFRGDEGVRPEQAGRPDARRGPGSRRLDGSGVTINVAHPDGTATNIAGRQKGLYGVLARLAFRTQRSPEESADVVVWLAASPDLDGVTGGFFHNRAPIDVQVARGRAGVRRPVVAVRVRSSRGGRVALGRAQPSPSGGGARRRSSRRWPPGPPTRQRGAPGGQAAPRPRRRRRRSRRGRRSGRAPRRS